MAFFFITAVSVLICIYLYVGLRLIKPAPMGPILRILAWTLWGLCLVSMPLSIAARYQFPLHAVATPLAWFAYISFGLFTLILPALLLRDGFLVLGRLAKPKKKNPAQGSGSGAWNPSRRLFLLNSTNAAILGVTGSMAGYGVAQAVQAPPIKTVDVPIAHLPEVFEGFRILQITDLHVSLTVKADYVKRVVERAAGQGADVVVFTGDMADGPAHELGKEAAPLAELKGRWGKYFVTGNHEYYSGVKGWLDVARQLGFTPLINSHVLIETRGAELVLAGITDYRAHTLVPSHLSNPEAALVNTRPDQVRILLAHQPKSIFQAAPLGVDLMISGHTHGGQYLPWNFMVPLDQPYVHGLHKRGKTQIYVSRGTGYWGPPMRIGAPSEITVLRLVKARSDELGA